MPDVLYNLNLVVSSIMITVSILFVLLFYKEWRKQARSENEQYIPLALMLLYLILSIGFIMMTNSNFFLDPAIFKTYIESGIYFYLLLSAGVLVIGISVYTAERIIPRKTKHIFIIYYCFLAASFYLFKSIGIPFIGFYLILLIPIGILMMLFAYYLIWRASGQIRQKMFIVTVGYITFFVAIILLMRFIMFSEYTLPFEPSNYVVPLEIKISTLIAAILAGYGFYSIPSFTEFDWQKKIRHLYLITPQGICLFQQSFVKASITDSDLFGGSLMAIQSLVQEMIQSDKSLQVIDSGSKKLIFEQSPYAVAVMLADEDLYIVHHKLRQLMNEFDLIFGDLMKDWNGRLHIFNPLEPMVKRIFELEDKAENNGTTSDF